MTTVAGSIHGIIVLGPTRSGKSLVCRILHHLGVNFGLDEKQNRGNRYNTSGGFEHREINQVNDRLLRTAGRSFTVPGAPETLTKETDLSALDDLDLSWMDGSKIWGLKDPRFCATITPWITAGKIKKQGLRIVNVRRDTFGTAGAALKYRITNDLFLGSFDAICQSVEEYKRLAQWQIQNLNLPIFDIQYEKLLEDPKRVVTKLAAFIQASDKKRIRRAASKVGMKKAVFRLALKRIPSKMGRLMHRLTGAL